MVFDIFHPSDFMALCLGTGVFVKLWLSEPKKKKRHMSLLDEMFCPVRSYCPYCQGIVEVEFL